MTVKSQDTEKVYYVYMLSRTPVSEGFSLENVYYVGKGRGSRWASHFKNAELEVRGEGEGDAEIRRAAKDLEISALFAEHGDDVEIEDFVYLVDWELTEDQAFRVEALMIKMLRDMPGVSLTNLVSGHHEHRVLLPAGEVRRYWGSDDMPVERLSDLEDFLPGGERGDEEVYVVVKGSAQVMGYSEDLITDEEGRFAGSVRTEIQGLDDWVRPGWDPRTPWTDDEARERGRHYWPMSVERAEVLREIALDDRLYLALMVEDAVSKRTVVRYLWDVEESDGNTWLDYGQRIGLPLGDAYEEHPLLGQCPVTEDGNQVLFAHSGGIAVIALTDEE